MSSKVGVERVPAHDGGKFDAHTVVPTEGSGAGLVIVQEIFGVGEYVKAAARRVADLGYVALAPDLYWRLEPNVVLEHDDEGLRSGLDLVQRLDFDLAVRDCGSALDHLRSMPEVAGRAGILGFCLGGQLAYQAAARFDPDTVVSYYGSGIPDALDLADEITCPILFHFGGNDPYIPRDRIDKVRAVVDRKMNMELHVHENAGHAFDNHLAPMFYVPEAARPAWETTTAFLARTLTE